MLEIIYVKLYVEFKILLFFSQSQFLKENLPKFVMGIFYIPASSLSEPILKSFNTFPLFSGLSLNYSILQIIHETVTTGVTPNYKYQMNNIMKVSSPLIHSSDLYS